MIEVSYKYTLVIPHYNIPQLLERLLKTVPERADLQVIVVDDCTKIDRCELRKIQNRYDWVEWYDTGENGGGGKARNIGLTYAKGKYVIFADADDYFEPVFNQVLTDYADKEFDIAFFKAISRDSVTNKVADRAHDLNNYIDTYGRNQEKGEALLRFMFGEPWCRLIRRAMIVDSNIRFEEVSIHNDLAFCYHAGYVAKKVLVDDRVGYCITYRSGSVSTTLCPEKILTRIKVYSSAERFFTLHGISFRHDHPYKQMVSLFVNGEWSMLNKANMIVRSNGLSQGHILKKCTKTFFKMLFAWIKRKISGVFF